MNRRTFLQRAASTGALLSVSALLEECASAGPVAPTGEEARDRPLLFALRCGMMAPNPHNSQAWKVRLRGDLEADLYVDAGRLLPESDPPARQIHIGQGTFLEHVAIAAPEAGCRAEIALFPEGIYSLADVGKKPVARIRLARPARGSGSGQGSGNAPGPGASFVPGAPPRDPLFAAMSLRTTNRRPFSGPAITAAEFQGLMEAVRNGSAGRERRDRRDDAGDSAVCDLRLVERGADPAFVSLLKQAFAVETHTRATNEETRRWFRFNDAEIEKARDGLSLRASGLSGINHFVVSRLMIENTAEYWNSEETKRYSVAMFEEQADSARGFVLFKTKGNSFREHVLAGRDFARFHLAAASLGLSLQPMSQVLQEYPAMNDLRLQCERLVGVAGDEKVQMIVRLGRSDYFFRSPRRDVAAITELAP